MRLHVNQLVFVSYLIGTLAVFAACQGPEAQNAKMVEQIKTYLQKGENQLAAGILKKLLSFEPDHAQANYLAGKVELENKNTMRAFELFNKAVQKNPELIDAQIDLAKILLALKRLDEVETRADFVLERQATHQEALLLKCSVLLARNELKKAETLINEMIERRHNTEQVYFRLAEIKVRQKDVPEAEKVLRTGIDKHSSSVLLHSALVRLLGQNKRLDEAVDTYARIIALEPDNIYHPLGMAGLYWDSGDKEKALAHLDTYLNKEEAAPQRRMAMAQFYLQRKEVEQAQTLLKEGLELAPTSFGLNQGLSRLYMQTRRTKEAIEVWETFLASSKDAFDGDARSAHLALIRIYLDHHALDQAGKHVQVLLKQNTEDVEANFLKGRMHLLKAQSSPAIAAFTTVLDQRPTFMDAYLLLAQAHRLKQNFASAATVLQKGLQVAPGVKQLHLALAQVQLARKDYKAAEQQYLRVLAIDPSDIKVQAQLGDFFLALNDDKRAEREYVEIVNKFPKNPLGYLKLSRLHMARQNIAAGIAQLEKGYGRNHGSPELITELVSRYMEIDKADRAISLCEKRLKAYPKEAFSHNLLGKIYTRNKKYKQALKYFEKAVELAPKWPEAGNNLAALHLRQGKTSAAIKNLKATLEQNPKNPAAYLTLGKIYEKGHEYEEAIDTYEQAVKRVPRFWAAANNLAFMLCQYSPTQKNLERALQLSLGAYQLQPGRPDIIDTIAWIQYHRGDHEQALALLQKIRAKIKDNSMYNYHLSMALLKSGQEQEALKALETALADDAVFPGRKNAEKLLTNLKSKV